MFDVTDYGAIGDGTGDDRDAIQAAVEDAYEAGGGRVVLPAGEYRVEGPITLRSGVHLVGEGMGATSLVADGDDFSVIDGFGEPGDPLTDLAVEAMTIDASAVGETGDYTPSEKCIYFQHVRRCRIAAVRAYRSAATGIGTDMMVDSVVTGCIAEGCGWNFDAAREGINIGSNGIGIGTGREAAAEPVVVSDCHARDNGNNGIMFENQATGGGEDGSGSDGAAENEYHAGHFFAHGCTATGNRIGFRTSADRRVRFANCSAHANEEAGIVIDEKGEMSSEYPVPPFDAREHRIDGCHITENGGPGVHVVEAAPDAAIDLANLHISANGGAGVRVSTGGPVRNVSVADCRIFGNDGTGVVFADGGGDLRVADCDVYDNGRANGAAGLRFGDSIANVTVSGNHVHGDAGTQNPGVHIAGGQESVALLGNQFRDCEPLAADELPTTVRDNTGFPTEDAGTAAATGDGRTAEFVVAHELAVAPSVRNVWPESESARGFYVAGADDDSLFVRYAEPPAEGADLRWGFEVRVL